MATLKQRLHKKNSSGSYDVVHLETSAGLVLMSDGTTVEAAVNGKAASSHTHSEYAASSHTHTGVYANYSHTHTASQITDLSTGGSVNVYTNTISSYGNSVSISVGSSVKVAYVSIAYGYTGGNYIGQNIGEFLIYKSGSTWYYYGYSLSSYRGVMTNNITLTASGNTFTISSDSSIDADDYPVNVTVFAW